ncbi:matrixin family metalloprotease [Halobacteriovorax sp. HLS]|uniref:matrixin family metalloprotease n=1 Tax=Halobacteriovorax sp. HLS TaxID=2234000 RepID=UPI000FDAC12E|nr:matrixin family metalloprotease [Halobacteriovorax sp. HLS]
MKAIAVFIICMSCFNSNAFTLVSSPPTKFPVMEVVVNVSSDSCSGAGITNEGLLDLVETAANDFWNSVTTSALVLKRGTLVSTTLNGVTSIGAAASQTTANTIIVGCSTNTTLFPTPGSDNTLGVGGIGSYSSGVKGAFLVNANGNFVNQGQTERLAVIAHELGHALGLGHSSDPIALMYYSVSSKTQERLTMDDKDGLTYLYPNEDAIAASCGSVSYSGDNGGGPSSLLLTLLGFLLLMRFARFDKKNASIMEA